MPSFYRPSLIKFGLLSHFVSLLPLFFYVILSAPVGQTISLSLTLLCYMSTYISLSFHWTCYLLSSFCIVLSFRLLLRNCVLFVLLLMVINTSNLAALLIQMTQKRNVLGVDIFSEHLHIISKISKVIVTNEYLYIYEVQLTLFLSLNDRTKCIISKRGYLRWIRHKFVCMYINNVLSLNGLFR